MENDVERGSGPGAKEAQEVSADLAGSARRGVVLTSGATGLRTVVELLTSIFLARLLEPREFGIVAVAAAFLGVSFVIGNLGIGGAVVQAKTLNSRDRNTAYFIASSVGLFFTVAFTAISPFVARFFEMPVLTVAMPIMSIQMLLSGAAATPLWLLRRRLQFGRSGLVDLASTLSYGVTSIGLAFMGFGVWSLVWAPVVAGAAVLALAHALSRFMPQWRLSRDSAKRLLGYGGTLTVKNVFVHLSRHVDKFIVAKVLGAHATGLYSRAFNWGLIPDMRLMPVLQTVCFPVFCRLRHDRERFVDWYLKAMIVGAIAMTPLALGLMVVADDFTVAVFGAKWRGIVPSLRILCAVGLLNSFNRLTGSAIEATGRLRYEVFTQSSYAVLLLMGVVLATPYGIEGVSWAVLGATAVLFLLKGETLRRTIGLGLRRYLSALLPSLGAGLAMLVIVFASLEYSGLPVPAADERDHWLRLIAGTVVGACVYPLALYLVAKDHLLLLTRQLSQMLRSAAGEAPRSTSSPGLRTVVVHEHTPHEECILGALFDAYARRARVVYVYADPGKWSLRAALKGPDFRSLELTGRGLIQLRVVPALPGSRWARIAALNRWLFLRALLGHLRSEVDQDPVLITEQPLLVPTFRGLPALRVYYVVDDYVRLQPTRRAARSVRRAQSRAVRQCDLVWATSQTLVEALREERSDVGRTTNGVDCAFFGEAVDKPIAAPLAELSGPVIGLIGRLNDRVDWALLEGICRARSDWSVVAVGPLFGHMKDTPGHVARLEKLAGFHHLPEVPEEAIPSYIAGFDICLIPYRPAGSNLSVNPLKLYQYLAVGKPVVATPIPALQELTDVIDVVDGPEAFVVAIEAALRSGSEREMIRQRQERARQFDWQVVADSQIAILEERIRSLDTAREAPPVMDHEPDALT